MHTVTSLSAVVLIGLAACGAPSAAPHLLPDAARLPRSHSSTRPITMAEIRASRETNAYDLVRRLRPLWLNSRGPTSVMNPGDVEVYLNGARLGDRTALREVMIAAITEVRYLDPALADFRYGHGHSHGVIELSTAVPLAGSQ